MAKTFEHILHIGAGLCAELIEYRAIGAKSITLFEPDHETATLLKAQTELFPEVLVVEAAVSNDSELHTLHRFSFADLNSLREPTGLKNLFPALEEIEQETVQVKDPVELVRDLQLSKTGDSMLVIDAPGEALSILAALDEANLLTQFHQLQISEGREELYKGAVPLSEICKWLEARYFSMTPHWDRSNTERPSFSVAYDCMRAMKDALAAAETMQQTLINIKAQAKEQENDLLAQKQKAEDLAIKLTDSTADCDHWKNEHGLLTTQLSDKTKAIERQTDLQARSEHQLALSREELLKAQGQITLISDLLLRGPAL